MFSPTLGCTKAVTKIVSVNPNITNTSYMFYGSTATTLDLSDFCSRLISQSNYMFYNSLATTIDFGGWNAANLRDTSYMFANSRATTLDLSGFNTSQMSPSTSMFQGSLATTGYTKTAAGATKLNATTNKPAGLTFVVKP